MVRRMGTRGKIGQPSAEELNRRLLQLRKLERQAQNQKPDSRQNMANPSGGIPIPKGTTRPEDLKAWRRTIRARETEVTRGSHAPKGLLP